MTSQGAVSFIVPAYNAGATLSEALAAIRSAMRAGDELIVYDDGSSDSTARIATEAGARVLRHSGPPMGPAHARNSAARAASNPLLLFVDADVVLSAIARDRLTAELVSGPDIAAAFGSYDDRPRSHRATSLYANLRHHFVHQGGEREAGTFWSGIGMIRREVFLAIGGFDTARFPHPSIEDVELGFRLRAAGHRIRLVPEAMGTHWKDWTLGRVWHTDIFRRALPWSRLIASGQVLGTDLNVSGKERVSALLALSIPPLLVGALFTRWSLYAAVTLAGAYLSHNRGFFGFLARRLSARQLVVAVVMHWCYHVYASTTFAAVMLATKLGRGR